MKKSDPKYQDYTDRMEAFNTASSDNKKRLLIELLVFNGYNIIEYCKSFNSLKIRDVKKQYKEQVEIYIGYH